MRQIQTFSDDRFDEMCSYCGASPDTRDHVPSRVLLDEPFPENLSVVPCCDSCNQSFSLDEAYFACLIECILNGTTNIEDLQREKVKRILKDNNLLRLKISNSMSKIDGQVLFNVEPERIKNVILKLAKGHIKYETSEPMLDEPTHCVFKPFSTMLQSEIDLFLANTELTKSAEVGSRAMQNYLIDGNNNVNAHWTIVQPNNYTYCVTTDVNSVSVKIIIWGYLAAEIIW